MSYRLFRGFPPCFFSCFEPCLFGSAFPDSEPLNFTTPRCFSPCFHPCPPCPQPCLPRPCVCGGPENGGNSNGENGGRCPVPARPTVIFPSSDSALSFNRLTAVGRGDAGNRITVCIDGRCGTTSVDISGVWRYTVPYELSAGNHSVTVSAENWCGSVSSASSSYFTIGEDAATLAITDLKMGSVYRTIDAAFRVGSNSRSMTVYYVLLDPSSPPPTADQIIGYSDEPSLTNGVAARGRFSVPAGGTEIKKSLRGREVDAPLALETGVVDGYPYVLYAVGVVDGTGTRTNVASYTDSAVGMPFESGEGTAGNPFIIRSYSAAELSDYPDQSAGHSINRTGTNEPARQLDNIQGMAEMNAADPSRGLRGTLAAEYLLGSDIDLSEYAAAYHNQGWRPIGTVERDTIYRFTGTFDGGGHTISNMTQALDSSVQTAKYSGLFGYAERASIKNLTLRAIRSAPAISGPVSVGGLAGALYIPSLSNVTVSEAVFDFNFGDGGAQNVFAGGVSGELNGGTLENVQASDISFDDKNGATDYSGGEYGYVSNAAAPLSFADSTVSNIRHLGYGGVPGLVFGGLAGLIYLLDAEKPMTMQRISASDVTADIENMDAGGVIGRLFQYAEAEISDIEASGIELASSASGFSYIGGIAGDVYSYAKLDFGGAEISSSTLSAYSGVGGALGHLRIFEGAYIEMHDVSVTGTGVTANNSYAGGLIGAVSRSGDSYLRIFSSQVSDTVKIDSPNQAGGLVGDLFHTSISSYAFIDGCRSEAEVDGSSVGRYAGGLVGFGNYVAVKDCTAACNVVGTREEFSVGGLFGEGSGVYLVNCHYEGAVSGYTRLGGLIGTAHGLNIGTSAYPAPFAVKDNVVELCSAKGTINALGVGQFIGGLAGEAKDILFDRCYSKTEIAAAGSSYVGGLTGIRENNEYNTLTLAVDCYYSGNITNAAEYVGGSAGSSEETLQRLFAYGTIAGTSYVAGILGEQRNAAKPTENCFALQTSVAASASPAGRVANPDGGNYSDNYALQTMSLTENGTARAPVVNVDGRDGGDVTAASLSSVMQAGGFTSSVWDFSSVASLGYPTLIDNPE